jgi:serine/threonine protein kinase
VDFGIAGLASRMNIDPTEAGSLRYMAPEVLSRRNIMANPAIDIWAMGCILYYMLHGYHPFRGEPRATVIHNITKGIFEIAPDVKKQISDDCFDCLHRMMTIDPELRMNIIEVSNHPWINEHLTAPYT